MSDVTNMGKKRNVSNAGYLFVWEGATHLLDVSVIHVMHHALEESNPALFHTWSEAVGFRRTFSELTEVL